MKKSQYIVVLLIVIVAATLGGWWYVRTHRDNVPTDDAVFAEIIARVDTDHDGLISASEWTAYGGNADVFNAYDFNGDGYLDVHEFEALFTSVDPRPTQ